MIRPRAALPSGVRCTPSSVKCDDAPKRRAARRLEHVDGARGSAAGDAPDGSRQERDLRGERRARIAVDERRVLDEVVDAHPRQLLLAQLEVRPVGRHEVELDRARGGERGHRRQRSDQLALATLLVLMDPLGRCGRRRRAPFASAESALPGRAPRPRGSRPGCGWTGQTRRAPQPAPRRAAGRRARPAKRSGSRRARGAPAIRRAWRHLRSAWRFRRPQRRPACPPDLQVDDHHHDVRPKLVHVGLQQRGHVDDAEGVGAEVEYLGLAARRQERALDGARNRVGESGG